MRYVYTYILVSFFNWSYSQVRFNVNVLTGTDSISDVGTRVVELQNGQFLSCGNVSNSLINYTATYLVKTDPYGNPIWKKQFDFSIGGFDLFTDLLQLPDSNYLLTGITTNTVTNDDDVFLVKIDTSGSIMWFQKYAHSDDDQSTALKLTPDGKIIIVGNTFSSGTYNDVLLIKTDLSGNLIWRKRFGNAFDEKYYSIEIIKNNTEYLLGGDYGYYSSGNPYYDMSLMRTDTAGYILWQQQYGISPNESGKCAIQTLDSGYAICGMYNDTGAVLKANKFGIVEWIKKFSPESSSTIYQVKQLIDSSYVMITSDLDWQNTNRTGYLIKANKYGTMLWRRIYPHPPTSPSIANYFFGFNTTGDKGFIITGQYNHIGQPFKNTWLIKTDSLGCDSVTCSYLPTNTKVTESNKATFKVFPNPSNGCFKISFTNLIKDGCDVSVVISNVLGQKVTSKNITISQNAEIEIKDEILQKGIYFISLSKDNVIIGQTKLIIE